MSFSAGEVPTRSRGVGNFLKNREQSSRNPPHPWAGLFPIETESGGRKGIAGRVQSNPQLSESHYYLGRIYHDSNRYELAKQSFETAIRLGPQSIEAYDSLGLTLDALGQPDEAQNSFKKAIELNERSKAKFKWPYLNLGELLLKQKQYAESIPYFEQALIVSPGWAKAQFSLGKALLQLGKPEEAKGAFHLGNTVRPVLCRPPRATWADLPSARQEKSCGKRTQTLPKAERQTSPSPAITGVVTLQ